MQYAYTVHTWNENIFLNFAGECTMINRSSDHHRILQVHKWMLFIHTNKEKELYILC
jgi:hypothetical protein